jgi:hypothetical protein
MERLGRSQSIWQKGFMSIDSKIWVATSDHSLALIHHQVILTAENGKSPLQQSVQSHSSVQKQKDLKTRKPHFPVVAPLPTQFLLHVLLLHRSSIRCVSLSGSWHASLFPQPAIERKKYKKKTYHQELQFINFFEVNNFACHQKRVW